MCIEYIYTEWGVQYWTLRYAPANWLQIEPKRRRALTKDFPSKIQAQIPGYCCFYIFLMENYSSLFQANGIPRVLENRKKICFFVYCNIWRQCQVLIYRTKAEARTQDTCNRTKDRTIESKVDTRHQTGHYTGHLTLDRKQERMLDTRQDTIQATWH